MDELASNYNPNAVINSVCDGGENQGLSCMDNADICGDAGVCVEEDCQYNQSYSFPFADQYVYVENSLVNNVPVYLNSYNNVPLYGVEIELVFDSSTINIPSLNFEDSIIDDYTKLYYVDNDTLRFVAYSAEPVLSGGLLFNLNIDAIGLEGEVTSIAFSKSILNDYTIDSNDINLILSNGLFNVSGNVGYY